MFNNFLNILFLLSIKKNIKNNKLVLVFEKKIIHFDFIIFFLFNKKLKK